MGPTWMAKVNPDPRAEHRSTSAAKDVSIASSRKRPPTVRAKGGCREKLPGPKEATRT